MPTPLPKTHALQQHVVLQCLAKAIRDNQSQLAKKTLWLACSGGRDSLALAYAAYLLKLPVHVLHVNHQLQPQSGTWASHVKDTLTQWQLPITLLTVTPKGNNEVAARQARYQALFGCMQANDVLMLAHHANDQVETLLMNLFKGTGLTGLAAMQPWSSQQHAANTYYLWRPWLGLSREQISDFAKQETLPYIDDPTNTTSTNDRGYLRQQVMPAITARWQTAVTNICRTSQNVAEAKHSLDHLSQADLQDCGVQLAQLQPTTDTTTSLGLDITQLLTLPKARQTHLLSQWLKGTQHLAPSRQCVEQVLALAQSTNVNQQAIIVFQNTHVRRYRHHLYQVNPHLSPAKILHLTAKPGKMLQLNCGNWQIKANFQINANNTNPNQTSNTLQHPSINQYITRQAGFSLDKSLLGKTLILRPRHQGERLDLVSRRGSTSLKQICQELQLAPWLREHVLIVCYQHIPIAVLTHVGCFFCRSAYLIKPTQTNTGWTLASI